MKTVKISLTMRVTDEFYESELKQLKNDILSGKHQRELMEDEFKKEGLKDVKATFELLKN